MKKTFLTLALAIFVMVGFAGNDAPEIIVKKKIENAVEKMKEYTNNIEQQEQYCGEVVLTCGLKGWVCGTDMLDLQENAWEADAFHCTFD